MPGTVKKHNKKLKHRLFSDCISIASFEQGFIINKDGSLSVGEEALNPEQFRSIVTEFSTASQQLPLGTVIKKLDIYWEDTYPVDIPSAAPFFHQKTLAHHHDKNVLKHKCYLFLRCFNYEYNPSNTFLALGSQLSHTPFSRLEENKQSMHIKQSEFIAAMPSGLRLRKLSEQEHEKLLYQYASLTFHREPLGFERDVVILPDSVYMGTYLKSVAMKSQAEEVSYSGKNSFGPHGVTSPFLWRIGHHARFPHIICQRIELIDDKKFRNNKRIELEYSAQLKIQPRNRILATHIQHQFLELEKILNERDTKIVKLDLHVLTWHSDQEILQQRTDYLKNALGKAGIEAVEEAEDTDNTFFAYIPGGTGFLEGCYMPLETAVAHLNFYTNKRGDQEGIFRNVVFAMTSRPNESTGTLPPRGLLPPIDLG